MCEACTRDTPRVVKNIMLPLFDRESENYGQGEVVNEIRDDQVWREPLRLWLMFGAAIILLLIIFYDGIEEMVGIWSRKEEYGYGFLIPVISAFFIWQKKNELERIEYKGSWTGIFVITVGIIGLILGELSTLFIIVQYSFLLTLYGVIFAMTGYRVMRLIWVPLFLLVFMIPLPQFLYQGLSAQLQLVSSELGVAFIRMVGISVYLEGNVIDLGVYKLQVVEACSGLRYLFPLMTLSFIAAYIFRVAFWKRAIIFLSSLPITIFMNSFRIGVIGILVDQWGPGQAEGFLHYFEGWIIFMACIVILILEMWALMKIGGGNETLSDLFAIDLPAPTPPDTGIKYRMVPNAAIVSIVLLVAATATSSILEERTEITPQREAFSGFPGEINGWVSHLDKLEPIILDVLKLDDYMISNFTDSDGQLVNFYVAYYGSQSKGESAHSPRTCIPGGGWVITKISQIALDGIIAGGAPLIVNRIIIQKGDYKQLVYYWFQGRGRNITSEYLVKWYLFWDALTKNRTDGALVRLTTSMPPGESIDAGDQRIEDFARDVVQHLDAYIPR